MKTAGNTVSETVPPGGTCWCGRTLRYAWWPEIVACHEHGTALSGFLPCSWDHLGCQSWDHPARLAGGPWVRSLTRHVLFVDVEVISGGIQGGQCG